MVAARITPTTERVSLLEAAHKVLIDELVDIRLTVREVLDKLHARPSWATTTYITIVTALAAGEFGYIINHPMK